MGITGLDQLNCMEPHIPFVPVDVDLVDKCYIIILDSTGAKNAHMGILIDLAGMSTDTEISGILIHLVANDNIQLPLYLTPPAIPVGTHQFIADAATPIILKRAYLHHLGSCMYFYMASQYQPIWSSSMNCQQLSRLFLTEGLGLIWPESDIGRQHIYHQKPK